MVYYHSSSIRKRMTIFFREPYERLITDIVRGDQTLFMRWDEVEAAWAWTDPILKARAQMGVRPSQYDSGSSGPDDALLLMHQDGRKWRELVQ